ncbi:H-type lectin domain-containing protein [Halobacterium sp. KA-6]|uniref:H-type lectin domain-containing protein n=1 Tax=Halobacterium sp. KA-6 TaxID=2896368 RepID=UPI001E5187EA|nr:H-type lectin domain-containing protein [Halobacterium sp. KA-6]MCD2202741.1 H-type lectin domain-containing protein [Halobacterium sp. KA-6]
MGVWAHGSQFAGYDYVQTGEPVNPEEGEMWYDMDNDRSLAYTGTEWQQLNIIDHGQLAGITRDAHHNPVSVEGPLRVSSGQVLDLATANGLTLDADGRLRVQDGGVTESMLAFGAVSQADLPHIESHLVTLKGSTGNSSVTVNFDKEFSNPPVVTANATDDEQNVISLHPENKTTTSVDISMRVNDGSFAALPDSDSEINVIVMEP